MPLEDELGDRIKFFEGVEAQRRLMPLLPAIARIDGRSFHSFTASMARPFDQRMVDAMTETTRFLVEETNARLGYTQSDEITLVFYEPDRRSQIFFDGRIMKLTSQLAALATVKFNEIVREKFEPEYAKKMPTFDARVFNVPTLEEAANSVLWREWDATKNAISMAARHYCKGSLHKKNGKQMQEMMWSQAGINFNDLPAQFKRGTYFQRKTILRKFDMTLDTDLPPKHAARTNPDLIVERQKIVRLDIPPLTKIQNRVGVVIFGEDAIPLASEEKS